MKKILIGLTLFASVGSFANTACMDEIESKLMRANNPQQMQQQQIQCVEGDTIICSIHQFFDDLSTKRMNKKYTKSKKETIAYLEFVHDLENNVLDVDKMRAVLGKRIKVNKVLDIFQTKSVCTKNDNGTINIVSKKEMKKLVNQLHTRTTAETLNLEEKLTKDELVQKCIDIELNSLSSQGVIIKADIFDEVEKSCKLQH